MASRQLLSFLFLPGEAELEDEKRAPSKDLFSLNAIPKSAFTEQPALINWNTRPVYDVDRTLLFWDQTVSLGDGNELHVRTAASDLLRTPVWSVGAGPRLDIDGLINKVLAVTKDDPDLKPVLVDQETTVRLVCYGYPRLGILFFSRAQPSVEFVVDLFDFTIIPVHPSVPYQPESVIRVWSPYDLLTKANLDDFLGRWEDESAELRFLPKNAEGLPDAVRVAQKEVVEEKITNPEVKRIEQENGHFCAPATAQMILEQHNLPELPSQDVIAQEMNVDPIQGATPQNQEKAIRKMSGYRFKGVLDPKSNFSDAKTEIRANRPFKVGLCSHARACGGFKTEKGGKEWLYIYDPLPEKKKAYYEAWEASRPINFMYIQPILHS